MATIFKFLFAWFIGWASSAMLLELYECARPWHKIEDADLESHKKAIDLAKNKLSIGFGLFVATAWIIYYWDQ